MIIKYTRNSYFYLFIIVLLNVALLSYQQKNIDISKKASYIILGVWGGTEAENFNKILKEFKRESGVDITYKPVGSDNLLQALQTRISKNGSGNLIGAILPQPSLIDVFLKNKTIKKIDSKTEKNLKKNYDINFWSNLIKRGDNFYGVPLGIANKSIFWFNDQNIDKETLTSINNPHDLANVAKKENKQNKLNFLSIPAGDGWPLTDFFELFYLAINGGEMYNQLLKHEIPYTDKSVTKTLQVLKEVVQDNKVDTRQTLFLNSVTSIYEKPIMSRVSYGGTMIIPYLLDTLHEKIGKDGVNYFTLFGNNSEEKNILVGSDVYVNFQDSTVSKKFTQFLSRTSTQANILKLNPNYLPAVNNLDVTLYQDKYMRDLYREIRDSNKYFDMSDAAPYGFASAPLSPEWIILTNYLYQNLSLKDAQKLLEDNVKKYE